MQLNIFKVGAYNFVNCDERLKEDIPISEKILQTLHNLCATAPDLARRSEELARFLQIDMAEVEKILEEYGCEGYVECYTNAEGGKRFFLTGKGIIKVCALFT